MKSMNHEIANVYDMASILLKEKFPELAEERFKVVLNRKVSKWESTIRSHLEQNDPFKEHGSKLNFAEWDFKTNGACKESIQNDLNNYRLLHPSVNVTFWEKKTHILKKYGGEKRGISLTYALNTIRRNELEAWKNEYKNQSLKWHIKEIKRHSQQLAKELEEWFETVQEIKEAFDELAIDSGILWDLCAEELSEQDVCFLKQWTEYLRMDKNVLKMCELMGRLQKEHPSERTETIDSTITHCVSKADKNLNELVVGIGLNRDLENVIPLEMALLSDLDFELLFDLKYVEKRLMCFSKQGFKKEMIEENIQRTVTVIDEEKKGPVIICLDTSNSMSGPPEYIAKALTLNIVSRAASQKRRCYLINFSSSIETFDLTPPGGIRDMIDFLKMSFHGVTDVVPALREGIHMMQNKDYKKADLLVISDFLFPQLPCDIVAMCKKQKQKENRFFALVINSFLNNNVDQDVFDRCWNYNTDIGSLSEMNKTTDMAL